jgi:hypothetical protein
MREEDEAVVWRRLKPEERVLIAIGMVDVVTGISTDNERENHPGIGDAALILLLRRRFALGRTVHPK